MGHSQLNKLSSLKTIAEIIEYLPYQMNLT